MLDVKVPSLGESVSEATIAIWHKKKGDSVQIDELILELETDKVTLEVNASASGVITEILFEEGDTVTIDDIVAKIDENATSASQESKTDDSSANKEDVTKASSNEKIASPAANKIITEKNLDKEQISGTGKDGRITKNDALTAQPNAVTQKSNALAKEERTHRVKMTRLRKTIAARLKESQNTAAILSTFNEIDMTNVMAMRKKYKDLFEKNHNTKLGFMSFFVKAVVNALKEVPAVNAEIENDEIVYKNFYDIGVAVGTEQGLVVPVVRDADQLNFAEIEQEIVNLAVKARKGQLTMADMTGGTFSITNGGIYGSLLSTPIINPPQSGILGMHKIQERPMVVEGNIVARPMMYIALSYDHRIIDGKEAVTFLVKVKEALENPERLLLNV